MGLAISLIAKSLMAKKVIPSFKLFTCETCQCVAGLTVTAKEIKVTRCLCV